MKEMPNQVPVDEADVAAWVRLAMKARVLHHILGELGDPQSESVLREDDSRYPWEKQSAWVHSYLQAGADHLMVWANIVNPLQMHEDSPIVNPPRAYLTLARGAMESSAQAAWVLLADNSLERTRRHLRLMYHDFRYFEEALNTQDGEAAAWARRRRNEIGTRVQGVFSFKSIKQPEPKYLDMIREAAAASGLDPDDAVITWRAASAAAHGKYWYFDYATVPSVGEEYEPGHYRVLRTPQAGPVTHAVELCAHMLEFATSTFAGHLGVNFAILHAEALIAVAGRTPAAVGQEVTKQKTIRRLKEELGQLVADEAASKK